MKYNDLLEAIKDKDIYELTKAAIEKYGSEDLETDAVETTKWVLFILKEDKIINNSNYTLFADILISAGLLHNLTYKYCKGEFETVFKTRRILNELALDNGIIMNKTYIDSICQTIEGQLGKNNEISALIPNPNSPGAQFALACSLYYNANVTIPDDNMKYTLSCLVEE